MRPGRKYFKNSTVEVDLEFFDGQYYGKWSIHITRSGVVKPFAFLNSKGSIVEAQLNQIQEMLQNHEAGDLFRKVKAEIQKLQSKPRFPVWWKPSTW